MFFAGNERNMTSVSSFLFSLKNVDNLEPFKMDVNISRRGVAAWNNRSTGPIFGLNDLYIGDHANSGLHSFSDLGHGYQFPGNLSTQYLTSSSEARNILAGSYYFIPDDIEVFSYEGEGLFLLEVKFICPKLTRHLDIEVKEIFAVVK